MSAFYRDLIAWQKAITLAECVYELTEAFPKREMYGLARQLRSAAVSVPSNIAEGHGRITRGEWQQFLGIARGSLLEVETELILASRFRYIDKTELATALNESSEVGTVDQWIAACKHQPGATQTLRQFLSLFIYFFFFYFIVFFHSFFVFSIIYFFCYFIFFFFYFFFLFSFSFFFIIFFFFF